MERNNIPEKDEYITEEIGRTEIPNVFHVMFEIFETNICIFLVEEKGSPSFVWMKIPRLK